MSRTLPPWVLLAFLVAAGFAAAEPAAPMAVRGDIVYTMAGPAIRDGVVLIENGKVKQVGPAAEVAIPPGMRVLHGAVVTPGLVDAHTVVGLTGTVGGTAAVLSNLVTGPVVERHGFVPLFLVASTLYPLALLFLLALPVTKEAGDAA